eukprot:1666177-Amphidinium_carterae.1
MVRACRVACGLPGDHVRQQPALPPPVQVITPPPPVEATEHKVKISAVADPLREQKVAVLAPDEVSRAYA